MAMMMMITTMIKATMICRCSNITIFRSADPAVIRALSRCLRPAYYLRHEYIVRKDDLADEVFFIGQGTVEVVSEDGMTVFDTMTSGEAFGEVGVMFDVPRTASVRAQVKLIYIANVSVIIVSFQNIRYEVP